MKTLSGITLIAILVCTCSNAAPKQSIYPTYDAQAQKIYSQMSENERIGQLLLPSYALLAGPNCAADIAADPSFSQAATISACGLDQIATYHIGTVLTGGGPYMNQAPTLQNWQYLNAAAVKEHAIGSPNDPLLLTGNDLVHGNQHLEGAVIFPHNIGMGVTHDPALVNTISNLAAQDSLASGFNWGYMPTVAVAQDLRWGRSYESFGADPALVKIMAQAEIAGAQDITNNKINGVLATVKHFIGDGATQYGLDEGDDQYQGSQQDFWNENGQGYEGAVNADIGSLMVSYSAIDGGKTRMHLGGDWNLLNQFKNYGVIGSDGKNYQFNGIAVSDWNGATRAAYFYYGPSYNTKNNLDQIIAQSINSGVDVLMLGPGDTHIPYQPATAPNNYANFTTLGEVFNATEQAVNEGLISPSRLQDAVTRILAVKLAMQPQIPTDYAALQAKERTAALQAAEESLVLLQNNNTTLPIQAANIRHVIFMGDTNDIGLQNGGWTINWQGQEGNQYFEGPDAVTSGATSLEQGVKNILANNADYFECNTSCLLPGGWGGANTLVVALVAEPPYAEYMGDIANPTLYDDWYNDSYSNNYMPKIQSQYLGLTFNTNQANMLNYLHNKGSTIVTVVYSGRPVVLSGDNNTAPLNSSDAVIAAFLPGTLGGQAIANAIFGQYHFGSNGYSNTLTFPWPANMQQVTDHFQSGCLFPVGYGLKD